MRSLSQPASISYSPYSPCLPFLLLPAPAPRLMLSAPKVAGFLPARVPMPFPDTVLMQNDPMPAPFVGKDRANIPPGLLKIIGHLPTPDEYEYEMNRKLEQIATNMDNAYKAYRAWREHNP